MLKEKILQAAASRKSVSTMSEHLIKHATNEIFSLVERFPNKYKYSVVSRKPDAKVYGR